MTDVRFRLIDTPGSELTIVTYPMPNVEVADTVYMPGGPWRYSTLRRDVLSRRLRL